MPWSISWLTRANHDRLSLRMSQDELNSSGHWFCFFKRQLEKQLIPFPYPSMSYGVLTTPGLCRSCPRGNQIGHCWPKKPSSEIGYIHVYTVCTMRRTANIVSVGSQPLTKNRAEVHAGWRIWTPAASQCPAKDWVKQAYWAVVTTPAVIPAGRFFSAFPQ